MVSLRERTQADVVVLDARATEKDALARMLAAAQTLIPSTSAAVLLCETDEAAVLCEGSPIVCAIGGYGDTAPMHKPFIRMDGTVEHALDEGADGYFAQACAETLFDRYGERITICGGLGAEEVSGMEPLAIHRRVQALVDATHGRGYLIGSGGEIAEAAYLSLISLLGISIRCH